MGKFLFSEFNKKPNIYALLQVKPNASIQEIRYNYFKLMSRYQTDKTNENDGIKQTKLVNQAYAILSNDKLKAKYDK